MKKKSHERAPDQTQITLSLPRSLKKTLTEFARADRRSRSNWIVLELEKLVQEKLNAKSAAGGIHALPMAAEEPPEYKIKRANKPTSDSSK